MIKPRRPYSFLERIYIPRYKRRTFAYHNTALLEAERLAQETGEPVTIYKEEGDTHVVVTVVPPDDQIEALKRRQSRLQEQLATIDQAILHLQQVQP